MAKLLISGLLISSIWLIPSLLPAQEESGKKIVLKQQPSAYSSDSESNIYLGFDNGTLRKLDSNGVELQTHSLPNQSSITLIEAQNNRRIFIFYRDIQQVTILDRFSTVPKQYRLIEFDIYLANMACPAQDGSIWIVENNPPVLKKIDLLRKSTIHEAQPDIGDSIRFMRSYQNLLFIADETGLKTLDQFGNLINTYDMSGLTYIQPWKGQLYTLSNDKLLTVDPYTSLVLKEVELPFEDVKGVLNLLTKSVVIGENYLSFFTLE